MTYAVVGCSDCYCHWIITEEHAVRKDTRVQCPRCGTTTAGKIRVLERTDNENEACELRSQHLAEQAGELDEYTANTSYTEAGDTFSLDTRATTPNDTNTNTDTDDHRTNKEQLVDELVEQKLDDDTRAFEQYVDATDVAGKDKYSEEAAAVLGTVGKHDQETRGDDDRHDLPDPSYPHDLGEDTPALTDVADLTVPDDAGLTPTQNQPAPGTITIDGNATISDIWADLTSHHEIQRYFLNAVKSAAYGRTPREFTGLLDAVGIEPTPVQESYRGLLTLTARGDTRQWDLVRLTQKLGTGKRPVSGILTAAILFRFANTTPETNIDTPTVTVEITHDAFKNRARNQREKICRLLSILSKSLNIRLSIDLMTQAYLRDKHRDDLRGVHEWPSTRHPDSHIEDAILDLDANGGAAEVLRTLNNQPSETTSYHELYATIEKARQSVRGYVSTLKDYGLINDFGPQSEKKFTLLDAGREVLDELNANRTRQTTLENSVHETPNSLRHNRVTRDRETGTGSRRPEVASHSTADHPADSTADTGQYQTAYLNRAEHDAIAASGGESGRVSVVPDDIEDIDSKTRFVSYDAEREEAIVSVHATNPQDYMVNTAVAFSSPRLLEEALDDATLDTVIENVPAAILRNAREIGYLTEDVLGSPASIREMFAEWGADVQELKMKLHRNEYGGDDDRFDDAAALSSKILRDAHGLTGSIVHLLDAAGVDVVRDVRVPAGLNGDYVDDLGETVSVGLMIQAGYGSHNAYRQLIEDREEKRSRSFGVEVDAADPVGSVIGSMVVRGGSAERVGEAVTSEFESVELHDDAPSFTVPVTVEGVSRENVAVAATRVLSRKNIRVTREIVSVLDGVVPSPFAVTQALEQLAAEPESREMDASELRYALTHVKTGSVLPDLPSSAGEIVTVLFDATEPLTTTEVADRIGKTPQTVRDQRDALESTGLVQTDDGWRVMLSFRFERGEGIVPETCSETRDGVVTGVVDAVDTTTCKCSDAIVSDGDIEGCQDPRCLLRRWLRVAVALTGAGHSRGVRGGGVVVVGVECAQTPVTRFDDRDSDPDSGSGSGRGPGPGTGSDSGGRRDASTETRSDGDSDGELDFSGVEIEGAIEY